MATIINTPGERQDSSAGWAVAVIILLVVLAGLVFWYVRSHRAAAPGNAGATIQVNLPSGGTGGPGGGGETPAQ